MTSNNTTAPNPDLGFASVAAVQQYIRYGESLNIDTTTALNEAGIEAKLLEDEANRIPGRCFQVLIAHLIGQAPSDIFGLQSGIHVQPGSYSVLGYLTMSCATLGEALATIPKYERLVGDMGSSTIDIGKRCSIEWTCHYDEEKIIPHMVDNVFASWVQYARWLSNSDMSPTQLLLKRSKPLAGEEPYQAHFGCAVYFDQLRNSIEFESELLALPLRQPSLQLKATLTQLADQQLRSIQESESDLAQDVRQCVSLHLEHGVARLDWVAERFNMSPRTLQRKLAERGVSFQSILDEVRVDRAKQLLSQAELDIEEIAIKLGLADSRSFYRHFKAETGFSPAQYRQTQARD